MCLVRGSCVFTLKATINKALKINRHKENTLQLLIPGNVQVLSHDSLHSNRNGGIMFPFWMNENVSDIQRNATCIPWIRANNPTQIRKCHFWIIYKDLHGFKPAQECHYESHGWPLTSADTEVLQCCGCLNARRALQFYAVDWISDLRTRLWHVSSKYGIKLTTLQHYFILLSNQRWGST